MNQLLTAFAVVSVLSAGTLHAAKIRGDVKQTAVVGQVVNVGIGVNAYARQDLNVVYDNVTTGGVRQSVRTGTLVNVGIGFGFISIPSCQSVNVIGKKSCRPQ